MPDDIDAVIFDFAGVLTTSIATAMSERTVEHGISLAEFLPIALGPFDVDGDHPWHRMERGELSIAEYDCEIEPYWRAAGLRSFPSPPDGEQLLTAIDPVPEMIEAARAVRAAGVKTAIVTNNAVEWAGWRAAWDADGLVDVVIESCRVGMRKPTAEIFRLALDELGGIRAERALFLDDFPWNVAGARAAGLQATHVTDPVAGAADLLDRLGLRHARPHEGSESDRLGR